MDRAGRQGWIEMVGVREARGDLLKAYQEMMKEGRTPAVYMPPTKDAANIVKAHSLDPEGLLLTFGISGAVHWGPNALPWVEREMLNTVTSLANNCFY